MRRRRALIFVFVLFVLAVLYWPNAIWMLRPQFAVSPKSEEGRALNIENAYLKSEIAKQAAVNSRIIERKNYEPTFVYARYPFNFKEELVISVGSHSDVKLGGAALVRANQSEGDEVVGVLIGNVSSTHQTISTVTTIFDFHWQSAVHIGSNSVPGLLEGGLDPKVVLVPKDLTVRAGDVVLNSDKRFEYGLPIGTVKNVSPSEDNLFQEVELDLPYDLSSISVLWVERESFDEE